MIYRLQVLAKRFWARLKFLVSGVGRSFKRQSQPDALSTPFLSQARRMPLMSPYSSPLFTPLFLPSELSDQPTSLKLSRSLTRIAAGSELQRGNQVLQI